MSDETSKRRSDLVRLRDVVSEDLPALFEYQLDPESSRMAVVNPRDLDGFNAVWAGILRDRSVVAKAIVVEGVMVGHVSCFKMDGVDAVGYWVARAFWGRGIATRALGLLLDEVDVRPLHARVARTNVGSIRVLERCGFRVVAFRECPGDARFPACTEAVLVLG